MWLLESTWVARRRTVTCSRAASAPIYLGSPCNGPTRLGTIDQMSTSSPIGDRISLCFALKRMTGEGETIMGSAQVQGQVWGVQARNWADLMERMSLPIY